MNERMILGLTIFLLSFLWLPIFPVKSQATILGDNTDYATQYSMSGNTKVGVFGSDFNVPSNLVYNISIMSIKIHNEFGANFRLAIYEIGSGENHTQADLIAYTGVYNNVVYGALVNCTLTYPSSFIALSSGTYLFSVMVEASIFVYGGTNVGHDEYHAVGDSWADGFSDPFGSGGIHNSDYSRTIFAYANIESVEPAHYPTKLTLGLIGLILIVISPTLTAYEVLRKKNYRFLITFLILIAIGYGLVVCWLA